MRGAITWNGRRLVLIGFDPAADHFPNPPVGGIPSLLVLDMTRDDWIRVPRPWRDRDWRQSPTIVNTPARPDRLRRRPVEPGAPRRRAPEGRVDLDAA